MLFVCCFFLFVFILLAYMEHQTKSTSWWTKLKLCDSIYRAGPCELPPVRVWVHGKSECQRIFNFELQHSKSHTCVVLYGGHCDPRQRAWVHSISPFCIFIFNLISIHSDTVLWSNPPPVPLSISPMSLNSTLFSQFYDLLKSLNPQCLCRVTCLCMGVEPQLKVWPQHHSTFLMYCDPV